MGKIIECVPNFSTSDPEVVESILKEIKSVKGTYLLDHTYDGYYNRLVVSYIGNTNAVYTSALNSAIKAIELIDMNKHKGQHPRIGAVDVVPFIPIKNVTIKECIDCARAHKRGRRGGEKRPKLSNR